ncbi:MAG: hypothetical protein ACRDP6_49150 [Actinoallomurus sp.]
MSYGSTSGWNLLGSFPDTGFDAISDCYALSPPRRGMYGRGDVPHVVSGTTHYRFDLDQLAQEQAARKAIH